MMNLSRHRFLLATSALVATVIVGGQPVLATDLPVAESIPEPPAFEPTDDAGLYTGDYMDPMLVEEYCEGPDCPAMMRGKMLDNSALGRLRIGENTERARYGDMAPVPFVISVDGQVVDESGVVQKEGMFGVDPAARSADRQRKTDVDLNAVDIQVKFDGLDAAPLLNVSTVPVRTAYAPGEPVTFYATSNYPAFVSRAEVRVHRVLDDGSEKLIEVLPMRVNSEAGWVMPAGRGAEFTYVLRVYDQEGRFDETVPLPLSRTRGEFPPDSGDAVAPGEAEDRTAFRNIPVYGGAVTVYGQNVPEGYDIVAFDELIPLDREGSFVAQRILPPGEHVVDIAVDGTTKEGGLYFSRDVNIPTNEWFYVGLADFTMGKRTGDEGIEDVRAGEYDEVWTTGRLAFYLRGKIKGKYLLTAAADTSENDIEDMFDDLDARDPRELLRRIDPDKYYPVYGDDSVTVEDAPTNGKFYVRLERGESHVMWGNYKTKISGTRFLQSNRGLYGGNLVYRSPGSTSFGERKVEATAYAALPDTLPQRDEFLGTGGSAYFLKRQDLVIGSETLLVEYRDRVTGRLIERRELFYGEDYSIDYLQGVVILKEPLSSGTLEGGPVRDGALGGYKAYLVAQYEYEPRAGEVDGYVYGGRLQSWIRDRLRIGVTGLSEDTGIADQQAYGADLQIRRSENTYIDAEIAYSEGPGFGTTYSTDGGLSLSDTETAGRPGERAQAWSVSGQMDLRDFRYAGIPGRISGYYEEKQAGFSSLSEQVLVDERLWGAQMAIPLTGGVDLELSYDDYRNDDDRRDSQAEASISWQYDAYWKAAFGVSYSKLYSPGAISFGKSGHDGSRMDAGVRIDYRQDDDYLYYGFAQATMDSSGDIADNDRYGVGTEIRLTEKLGVEGEISYGESGIGGLAGLTYDPTVEDHYYLGYRLDPDRALDGSYGYDLVGVDRGELVAGLKKRINDVTSAYSENNYDLFGRRNSLAQTYGVIYTPDAMWTVDAGFEAGTIEDDRINPTTGQEYADFERYAGSLTVAYNDEELGISGRARGEARFETSDDDTRNVNTYLLSLGGKWQHDDSGRVLGNVDAVISESDKGMFYDGDYVEASLGYAYRPVDNDLLNALFRYTFLFDLPGNDTISGVTGAGNGPMQRSHVVSADLTYDLLPWLSVGGKYGVRLGEIRYRRTDGSEAYTDWEESNAHLGIVRTDLHVVKNWDALLEGRAFYLPDIDSTDYGFLAALYRHMGNHFKVGAGYNFGRFSDDLTDLTLDDRGPFMNVVGKF